MKGKRKMKDMNKIYSLFAISKQVTATVRLGF